MARSAWPANAAIRMVSSNCWGLPAGRKVSTLRSNHSTRVSAHMWADDNRLPFSDNHNPALGWHPAYLWNADQRPQQYTHQHHEPSPKPRHHGHRPPLWTRSPQTEKQNDHRRRRSLDSAGKRATTLPATPKQTQRRHESKSPFKKVLRSAGRLSRGILVTPGRIRAQVARPPSRAQDESSGGEAVEGEEDVAEASYGSDDDGRALVTWSLENLTLGVLDGERGSRDVGRLWMQRGDSRSGSSPTCNVRDKTCSTGIWQQPDRRDFSPPNGGDQQQPRPDSRPGPGSRRPATGRRDTGKGTSLDSDMSDLEGYRQISRMNGLLDIWDAKDNPQWEEQTFALCNLGRCKRCGRFYAPMGTVAHRCRMVTSMGRHY